MTTLYEMPFCAFWVGQKCTLRCKHCCNLIPWAKQKSYDADLILADLEKLLSVAKIQYLQIQGGEPITHREIARITAQVVSLPNIEEITIATNGTLLCKQDMLDVLRANPRIKFRISNYPCADTTREKLQQQLEHANIPFVYHHFWYGNDKWFNSGGASEQRIDSDIEMTTIWKECVNRTCPALIDGKLYRCGKLPVLNELHSDTADDSLDIRNGDTLTVGEQLKHYLTTETFRDACRYCLGTNHLEKVDAAIQF